MQKDNYLEKRDFSHKKFEKNDISLVRKIAHHMILKLPQHVCLDDLIQAGCIGLVEAYNQYDSTKGASFATYASIRIRGAMIDEMRRGDWAPRSVHRNARLVTKQVIEIEKKQGYPASRQDLADALSLSLVEIDKILQDYSATKILSYEELGVQEDLFHEDLFHGSINPLEIAQSCELQRVLVDFINKLPPKESLVLKLYFHEQQGLKEIASQLSVSESRVSQIISSGIAKLKPMIERLSI